MKKKIFDSFLLNGLHGLILLLYKSIYAQKRTIKTSGIYILEAINFTFQFEAIWISCSTISLREIKK